MTLHIHTEAGQIVNVYCRDVPEDLSDDDVLYTFQQAADNGDAVAKQALPYLARPCWRPRAGVRVYLDNA